MKLLQTDRMHIIFSSTSAGVLSVASIWPTQQKAKTVYFARKNRDVIPRDAHVKHVLIYGDLSYALVDHLSAFVEQVGTHPPTVRITTIRYDTIRLFFRGRSKASYSQRISLSRGTRIFFQKKKKLKPKRPDILRRNGKQSGFTNSVRQVEIYLQPLSWPR